MNENYSSCINRIDLSSKYEEYTSPPKYWRTWHTKMLGFVMVLLVSLGSFNGMAQNISNYAFATGTNGNLEDLSAGSTNYLIGNLDDTAGTVQPLGLNFVFMGTTYSHFSANSNGQMQLHTSSGANAIGTNVSTVLGAAILAPFTGDNEVGNGLRFKVIGSAPNRTFVLEWNQFYVSFANLSNAGNMQAWLEESTGKITYVYGEIYNSSTSSQTRSISIASSNTATTVGSITIGTTPSFTASATLVSNTIAIGANPIGSPLIANIGSSAQGTRRFFTFAPPSIVPSNPTTLTFTAVTAVTITPNWVDNSTNEIGFSVTRALDAGFTSGVISTILASTTTVGTGTAYTLVQTALSAGTTYYYRIQAVTEGTGSSGLTGFQATTAGATYYWVGTTNGSFALAANWNTNPLGGGSTRATVANTDVLIIDGDGFSAGGATTINVPASISVGQLQVTGNTSLTLQSDATATRTITITGGGGDDLVIASGSTLNLTNLTNAVAFAFSGTANTGLIAGTYNAAGSTSNNINTTGGTGTLVTVASTGVVNNTIVGASGCMTGSALTLSFANGSNYSHGSFTTTNGFIPLATWGATSTVTITGGTTSTGITNAGQSFGNFTYNSTTNTGTMSVWTSLTTTAFVRGNLTVTATGTGFFRAVTSGLVTVTGDLIVNGGTLESGNGTASSNGVIVLGNTTIAGSGTLRLNAAIISQRGSTFTNDGVITGTVTGSTLQFLSPNNTAQTLAGSGTVLTNIATITLQNLGGLTITHINQIPVLRVNLFGGNITNSDKITFGTGLALNTTVQIGAAGLTTAAGSFDIAPTFNLGTGLHGVIYAQELGARTTGFEIPSTRTLSFLTNSNSNGLTISGGPLSTGTLTFSALSGGTITTSDANLLTVTGTTAGSVVRTLATAYVNGPLARAVADSNAAYVVFPVGKSTLSTVELLPATTSASIFKVEAFDINSGTTDGTIVNLSATKRWEAIPVSGSFTDIKVKLFDSSIVAGNIPAQAPTAGGNYTNVFGNTATFTAGSPNSIVSNTALTASNYTGYLSYGLEGSCSGTPAPGNTIASSSTICFGASVSLSLQNAITGSGVTYQWKSSTDGVTYTAIVGATASTLSVTPTAANYYLCEVTCTGSSITTASTALHITFSNNVASTTPASRCGVGTVTLAATGSIGTTLNWYSSASGGTSLFTGSPFTTPSLSTTTNYFVEASTTGAIVSGARTAPTNIGNTTPSNYGLVFDVSSAFDLLSVDVFNGTTSSGTFVIQLQNSTGAVLNTSGTFTAPAGTGVIGTTIPYVANLGWDITPGTGYRLLVISGTASLVRESSLGGFPYAIGTSGSITGGYFSGTSTSYYYLYNWKVQSNCSSPRTAVIATISTPPALTVSNASLTICSGANSSVVTVTSNVAGYDGYVWSPATGVTGDEISGWVFNPTVTTTYTLTASQTAGSLCVATATVDVAVNSLPSALVFSPTAPQGCVNEILPLISNGGTIGSSGATPIGTATTLTGTTEEPTAFNNRYDHYWLQMVFTKEELNAAGIQAGNINGVKFAITSLGSASSVSDFRVNIGSTIISTLTGFIPTGLTEVFTAATYSQTIGINSIIFSTPYVWDGTSNVIVDIRNTGVDSVNNSQTYYTETTDNKAVYARTSTPFASSNAYVASNPGGTLSLKRLNTTFDWSSSEPTAITWSPSTNLYTDAAATVAYVNGANAATVYVKLASIGTTNYTATATSGAGCTSSSSVNVAVSAMPTVITVAPAPIAPAATVDLTAPAITAGSTAGLTFAYFTNAGATTPVATPTAVGVGTYYIKGANTSGCSAVASVKVSSNVTTYEVGGWDYGVPTASIDAVINSDFTTTVDLSVKSLTINTGKVITVKTGTTLTVVEAIVNNAGITGFIVESDGVVLQTSTAANTALATVLRNSTLLYRQDYTLWSSPVSGQNLRNFSPFTLYNRFYSYNTTGNVYAQEILDASMMNKNFVNAKGYLIRMPNLNDPQNIVAGYDEGSVSKVHEGSFKGTLNNGPIAIPLSDAGSKFNLVGNPYASPILISELLSVNASQVDNTLYFWRKKNSIANPSGSGYVTYVAGPPGSDGTIASSDSSLAGATTLSSIKTGQGFFVIAKTGATSLSFNNSMRQSASSLFFKSASDNTSEIHRFWLNLSNSTNVVGQTVVSYATGATQGVDNYDAPYFNDSPLALTSIVNNTEYIIQSRAVPFVTTDVVPLGFKTDVAGSYTIALANFDGLFAGNQDIFLKDNDSNTLHNLKLANYTFMAQPGVFNTRFEVHYNTTLGTNNPIAAANQILIGVKNQQIKINAGITMMEKIELIDVAGRVIYTVAGVNATTATIENIVAANQVLIVRISTKESGVVNQKIIF